MRFLSAFSVGVSVRLADFARLDGTSERSSDVVDRAVDADLIDMVSFSDPGSMLLRYVLVIVDMVGRREIDNAAYWPRFGGNVDTLAYNNKCNCLLWGNN